MILFLIVLSMIFLISTGIFDKKHINKWRALTLGLWGLIAIAAALASFAGCVSTKAHRRQIMRMNEEKNAALMECVRKGEEREREMRSKSELHGRNDMRQIIYSMIAQANMAEVVQFWTDVRNDSKIYTSSKDFHSLSDEALKREQQIKKAVKNGKK